jgi:threonine dehydrogenase-like Zn-dependent dehydrogenase
MRGLVFRPDPGRVALGILWNRIVESVPLFAAGPVALENLADAPLPGPNWVRVRCRLAGICGSDLKLLRCQFSLRSAALARQREIKRPICLGHEAVGEVIELGPTVKGLAIGQRVVLVPGACCAELEKDRRCEMCAQGLPLLCLHRDEARSELTEGAAWSEVFVRHCSALLPVPDEIPDEHAVLIEPLACSLHAVLRRPPSAGDSVVVIGCGTIGLGTILVLRALGRSLRIIAVARHAYQAAVAKASGADAVFSFSSKALYQELAAELETVVSSRGSRNRLLQQGASVVYDAVGNSESLHHALRWAKPRGAVVLVGISARPAPSDCTTIWLREVDLVGSHGHGIETFATRRVHSFELVMDWLKQQRLVPAGLITHRLALGDYRKALTAACNKTNSQAIKVVLEMMHHDTAHG